MPEQYTGPGKVGLTIVPGRRDYGRSLQSDIQVIKREQIDAVICLLANDEFARYGVDDLLAQYREAGLDVLHLPTIDRTPPSDVALEMAMTWIGERVSNGKRVLIHCVGGLGRAGTVAGCWLKQQGLEGDAAIALVREFRSARAIETKEQEMVVREFYGT